jgi:hypothetical protein
MTGLIVERQSFWYSHRVRGPACSNSSCTRKRISPRTSDISKPFMAVLPLHHRSDKRHCDVFSCFFYFVEFQVYLMSYVSSRFSSHFPALLTARQTGKMWLIRAIFQATTVWSRSVPAIALGAGDRDSTMKYQSLMALMTQKSLAKFPPVK